MKVFFTQDPLTTTFKILTFTMPVIAQTYIMICTNSIYYISVKVLFNSPGLWRLCSCDFFRSSFVGQQSYNTTKQHICNIQAFKCFKQQVFVYIFPVQVFQNAFGEKKNHFYRICVFSQKCTDLLDFLGHPIIIFSCFPVIPKQLNTIKLLSNCNQYMSPPITFIIPIHHFTIGNNNIYSLLNYVSSKLPAWEVIW